MAAALCLLPVFAPLLAGTRIVMLDVGQGDAILLQSEGRSFLVDTGNHDALLIEALGRNHVAKLDGVLITHADDDHCGSLDALAQAVTVDEVFLARPMLTCQEEGCRKLVSNCERLTPHVHGLAPGDVLQVGRFSLKGVWPNAFTCEGGNADSLTCLVGADVDQDGEDDATALLTGDAEIEQLREIAATWRIGAIDILKVAHHGSDTGTNDEIAGVFHPKIALVSVGADNCYGHPKQSVITALEAVSSAIYRTDRSGDVSCKIEADGVRVTTQR